MGESGGAPRVEGHPSSEPRRGSAPRHRVLLRGSGPVPRGRPADASRRAPDGALRGALACVGVQIKCRAPSEGARCSLSFSGRLDQVQTTVGPSGPWNDRLGSPSASVPPPRPRPRPGGCGCRRFVLVARFAVRPRRRVGTLRLHLGLTTPDPRRVPVPGQARASDSGHPTEPATPQPASTRARRRGLQARGASERAHLGHRDSTSRVRFERANLSVPEWPTSEPVIAVGVPLHRNPPSAHDR